jgi:hypothetical protein
VGRLAEQVIKNHRVGWVSLGPDVGKKDIEMSKVKKVNGKDQT